MKRIVLIVLSFLPVLALSGCGKTEGSDTQVPTGKVRYAALGANVRGLDPGDIGDVTSSSVASQGYECLYQYHFLKRPYEIIPCLAESMPQISKDGLTYTIKIRKDVYFFDDPCFPNGKGRQLTVHDFIYAWKRIANIKYLSKNWWIFENRIVGLDEFRNYTKTVKTARDVDYSRPVSGLTALDDFTLQIKLKQPWPQIIYILAHLPTAPMAKEAVDKYGQSIVNVMVGTGPFKLKSWQRGGRMILVRNPTFRKELYPSEGEPGDREKGYLDDAGKPLPLIDGFVYDVVQESQPRWLLFLQGKIDAAGIPKDFFSQAITQDKTLTPFLRKKGIGLIIEQDPDTYWIGFNMEDPVVGKNLALRRAMSMAYNREENIDIFMNGRGIPAKGLFPPMFKEFDKNFTNPWCQYNLEGARKLMKEAEKINGGPITVTLSMPGADTTSRQSGEYFKRSMAKIGVKVKLDYLDWPMFQDKVKTKSVQMFTMGWVADYPDGENFMMLFYSPNESPGPNNFNYKNPKIDELFRKAQVMPDTPERLKLYRQMERIICDDVPAIFEVHSIAYVPYYTYLKNNKPSSFAWGAAKYGNIDLELRKKLVGR